MKQVIIMSIKLIAVDIDGTLLNSQRQVTPEVFQAIQDAKAAGVKVVIATGRPIPGVLPLLEELNLNQDGDYVITFNGGLVQETSTGNELIRETLSYEDYLDIEVLANKLGKLLWCRFPGRRERNTAFPDPGST